MSEDYTYDALGNLKTKTGVGLYSFTYDSNGNITNDGKRSFTYTAFEKPSRITQGTDTTDFVYGPNRELIQRIDKRGSNTTSTLMLDGIYEQVTLPTGIVEHKYYVADTVVTKRSNSTTDILYLHKDQQGSTTAITNAAGNTVQQLMYDPWGKQFLVNNSILTYTSPAQSKGYTGHEMVNDFEVIHMGGRTYNPTLGRFMQADPFIQEPTNLQSYNRYSYVMNNPMSMTDPSGYFFSGLKNKIKKYWKVVVAVAVVYFTAGAATSWVSTWGATWGTAATAATATTAATAATLTTAGSIAVGAMAGAAGGFVGGALETRSLTGALRGAAAGAIAGAAGGYANSGSVRGWGDAAKRVAVSAAGGCAAGEASGGSCGKGARTAAMVQALTMGASETYKKVSAKYNNTGEPHLWQEGQNDVGKQYSAKQLELIKKGDLKVTWDYDQSGFMKAAGKGPYMDAFGEFHDGLHNFTYVPGDQFSLIATMPASYALTAVAAMQPYSHLYYLDLIRKGKK